MIRYLYIQEVKLEKNNATIFCNKKNQYLENLSSEEIVGYEIKTGAPLVYELTDDLEVKDKYYL